MKATDILKELMEQQGVGQTALGKRIGIRNDTVYQRLKVNNIGINTLHQMLSVLDYKILIVPTSRQLKTGEYEVDDK